MVYDIIVSGLGCAGFTFMHYLLQSPLSHKKVLILDVSKKDKNDRTWCYWSEAPLETHPDKENAVYWKSMAMESDSKLIFPLDKLKYFTITSSDFYEKMMKGISGNPNVTFVQENISEAVKGEDGNYTFKTKEGGIYRGKMVVNSVPLFPEHSPKKILKQYFLGWKIKTSKEVFKKDHIVFMDFDNSTNSKEFSFFYTLPYQSDIALVEYTAYSKEPVNLSEMKQKLEAFIKRKYPGSYDITFEESGAIPMSTLFRKKPFDHNWHEVGTVGGCTKASTGYTFHTIQKHCKMLITSLVKNDLSDTQWKRPNRFRFYDNILLNIVCHWPEKLPGIFMEMFQKVPADSILKFLNEETTFWEEINILRKLSFGIFIKSLMHYERH